MLGFRASTGFANNYNDLIQHIILFALDAINCLHASYFMEIWADLC